MIAWVIDDDKTTRMILNKTLQEEGYEVVEFPSAEGVIEALTKQPPSIIILDVRMPDKRGTELCRDIRTISDVPVLFLSSAHDPIDKVIGLEIGGDDYMPKPFDPREFSARIRAIQRRASQVPSSTPETVTPTTEDDTISLGILTINLSNYITLLRDTPIQLTKIEFEILSTLLQQPDHVFSREELMNSAYEGVRVSKKTIDSHVHRVRSNFTDFNIDPIRTVRGFGYAINREALEL